MTKTAKRQYSRKRKVHGSEKKSRRARVCEPVISRK